MIASGCYATAWRLRVLSSVQSVVERRFGRGSFALVEERGIGSREGDMKLLFSSQAKCRAASLVRFTLALLVIAGAFPLAGCTTLDKQDTQILDRYALAPELREKMRRNKPLTLAEIEELSRRGVPGGVIIRYIENSFADYPLTTDEIIHLRQAGVSHEIIDYMLASPASNAAAFGSRSQYRPISVHRYYDTRSR